MQKKIILLAGPTASGKSKLAIKLAKKINGEIVNADSMQIYKEFSILSSRPSKKDLREINHHLYGFLSVKKRFSAGNWLKLAKIQINKIHRKKKIPIIVGGTGLYFKTITQGISKIPYINKIKRKKIVDIFNKYGKEEFYRKLIKLDPKIKNKILPSDTQRLIRAYEVKSYTKKSLYEWSNKTKSDFENFNIKKIYLDIPRDILLKNIEQRTALMFKKKCIMEVVQFLKIKLEKSLSANKMIGVREIKDYLSGLYSLDDTQRLINIKTRQYAKRQNTWYRGHMHNWNKLYSKDFSVLLKKTLKEVS